MLPSVCVIPAVMLILTSAPVRVSARAADDGILNVIRPPYRADATGRRDCTEALQRALNEARDKRLVVYLPPDDFIYFPSAIPPQTFEMDGRLHRLELLGFGPDADHLTDEFQSPEASTNATLLWARITEVEITIDIKPGSFPNSINLKSKGVIPVAILTTEGFDASTVDPAAVRFGPDEASPVQWALEDVDNDGDIDMILHFKTQETGINPGDTEATLTGETMGGADFVATDSVRTVPPA